MKTSTCFVLVALILIFCFSCEENQMARTKEQAKKRSDLLRFKVNQNFEREQFEQCLANVEEILYLCERFSFQQDFIFEMTDKKQFILQKLGRFDEALRVAFELEEMSQQLVNRKSPWNYLKIADSYLGMQNEEKAVEWMKKAVYERGFKKYKYFQHKKYQNLHLDRNFQTLINHMKVSIGLEQPAKDFSVKLLDGENFRLSSQKGKVVLIDFWDVYCPPCIKAIPELNKLFRQYSNEGLEIIGISLDTDEKKLLAFLGKNYIPWKIACSYQGWKDETAILYGINATPTTWLIDRKGILRYYNLKGAALENAIGKLIEE